MKLGSEIPRRGAWGSGNLFLFAFGLRVLAAEALDAARGVEYLLLAGEERVAGRADFDADIALMGRPGQKGITACAMHTRLMVIGVNSCFHNGSETSVENIDDTGAWKDSQQKAPRGPQDVLS